MQNKKRLIDANALMDAFRSYMVDRYDSERCVSEENCKTCENLCLWRKIVSVAPTVDAVEVVHGEWRCVSLDPQDLYFTCTNCRIGYSTIYHECEEMKYCPNCGAKMVGDINA